MRTPLHTVALERESVAREAMNAWYRYAGDPSHPLQPQWQALTNRQGFLDLAEALVGNFIVCAVCDPLPGTRQILNSPTNEEPFAQRTRSLLPWALDNH